jgi:hypothetical protein
MMPVPSHLAGWVVPKDPRVGQRPLDAWIRCPCGCDRFAFLYPGETMEDRGQVGACYKERRGH